jgi:hypothetical protein
VSKLNDQQLYEIEVWAKRRKSGQWIARKMGLPSATINYRMLRLGYDPWPGKKTNTRGHRGAFSAEEDAKMLELGQTLPIHRIAAEMKRPITSIRIRLMTLEVRAEKALEAA